MMAISTDVDPSARDKQPANAWLGRTKADLFALLLDLPEKTITWGVCSSLKTLTLQFTSQLPRLGFQQSS
jgi:hypothetical protein